MAGWQFADLIAQMVDAGVTNTGEGKQFFQEMHP
jgi:polyhydroxyalkanoate synthesis regulator phasin